MGHSVSPLKRRHTKDERQKTQSYYFYALIKITNDACNRCLLAEAREADSKSLKNATGACGI
jgi:hypothetical protein